MGAQNWRKEVWLSRACSEKLNEWETSEVWRSGLDLLHLYASWSTLKVDHSSWNHLGEFSIVQHQELRPLRAESTCLGCRKWGTRHPGEWPTNQKCIWSVWINDFCYTATSPSGALEAEFGPFGANARAQIADHLRAKGNAAPHLRLIQQQ